VPKTPRFQELAPQGCTKGEEEHTHRHTVKAHVKEDRTGSRLTYAEKERVKRNKKRRNVGRAIRGRGIMEKNGVGGKGERSA